MNALPPSGPLPGARAAFTLVEILATLALMIVLAALLVPALRTAGRSADLAKDTANLRSYGVAVHQMANEMQMVSAGDILRSGNTTVDRYTGNAVVSQTLLNSSLWTRMTRTFAASQGRTVSARTRSYTLNSSLFPPKAAVPGQPPPAPWEIDSVSPISMRSTPNRPLLFTGVYFAGHDGAYVWGGRPHANPIYSGIEKQSVTSSIMGSSLVLFVGGHVRAVDFTRENLPASGPGADPDRWWIPYQN